MFGEILSRRGSLCSPSRPVVKSNMYRPIPSRKLYVPSHPVVENVCPVPSRPVPSRKKDVACRPVMKTKLPSRPVMISYILSSRPGMKKVLVGYRAVSLRNLTPTLPSRPAQPTILFIFLPSCRKKCS